MACTGPKVAQFEEYFRSYKCAPHAVAVNSCTAAMHLSMLAAGIGPSDEVITTPITFCATVNVIVYTGAIPVLADIDAVTMNINPEQGEAKITRRTKAILPDHVAGRPCDMDAVTEIADKIFQQGTKIGDEKLRSSLFRTSIFLNRFLGRFPLTKKLGGNLIIKAMKIDDL